MANSTVKERIVRLCAGMALAAAGIGGVHWAGAEPGIAIIVFYAALGLLATHVPWGGGGAVAGPLSQLRDAIESTRNDGDLSRRVGVPGDSSVAPAARAYNELIASFQGIATRIVFNSTQVAKAADCLIEDAKVTADGSARQSDAAEAAAEAVAELAGSIGTISANADETARIAEEAREHSERGVQIVGDAAAEIERIARSVEQSATVVAALGERSEAISGIVRTIHEIADQTNLLALNAAIEAARAGEAGRGFAVVADEVRKLAERTTGATSEISAMISAIQGETQSAIRTIREGSAQARTGADLARQAADALARINQGARETKEKVAVIASAMSEQNSKTQDIAEHVSSILGLADSNREGAERTLAEATNLDYLAMNLEEIGTIFKLGQAGDEARQVHERMPDVVRELAAAVGKALEGSVDRGEVKLDDLFDKNYAPIPDTKPQKFRTRYDGLCDKILPAIQEPPLERHREIAYAIACSTDGYVPTHNRRFTQPLTGDEKKDVAGNRTKRIFADPVGKRCGAHELPFLLQTYRRDTGEIMHDISAPVFVKGKHWGGFRVGYRTE